MSIRLESRSLLQQDLFTQRHAGKFAQVNSEGKQLAVGGRESPGEVPGGVPAFLGGPFQKGLPALLCSCWP